MNISLKNTTKNENGFSIVELLLVLVLLGALVFVGFYVANKQDKKTAETPNQQSAQQEQPVINDSQDLQSAEENLDDINLDELDTTELDAAEADLL